ncbi:hypothetical protein ACPCG0_01380 [Propionibacteriaceae bacterium Y1923]|uniref:hypothetical protein n=1 Tax=Aestuariimicrobium sp. Y1814 TaxID=3418742 RepID=UPI003C22A62F
MSAQMKYDFRSWRRAAAAVDTTASGAPQAIASTVAATTSAQACGAAGGLATVDGAVSIMLSVFAEIMNSQVVPGLQEGLDAESVALTETVTSLEATEEENASLAGEVW